MKGGGATNLNGTSVPGPRVAQQLAQITARLNRAVIPGLERRSERPREERVIQDVDVAVGRGLSMDEPLNGVTAVV